MKYETIKYEVESNILTLTLNRPEKLNAFTGQMMDELISAFDEAGRDAVSYTHLTLPTIYSV